MFTTKWEVINCCQRRLSCMIWYRYRWFLACMRFINFIGIFIWIDWDVGLCLWYRLFYLSHLLTHSLTFTIIFLYSSVRCDSVFLAVAHMHKWINRNHGQLSWSILWKKKKNDTFEFVSMVGTRLFVIRSMVRQTHMDHIITPFCAY